MTYLGLDLGTAFARLARCQPGEPTWPDRAAAPPAVTRVPAAVAYRGLGTAEIPGGYADEPASGTVRCDGFPAMLGTALAARQVAAWRGRTPYEVTRDFLRCLLDSPDNGLVVAVPPETGTRRDEADGQDVRSEIPELLTALGLAPRRLVTAPVAALLWLRDNDPALAGAARVAVIDIGAGSAEFSLCTMAGPAVRVVDSIRLVGRSAWDGPLPAAADRPPTIAECLTMTLATAAGARIGPGGQAPAYWWRAFESALADDRMRDRLDAVLQLAAEARHRHGNARALRFGDIDVTASQLLDSCGPLARRSVAALGQLLGRQADPGWQRFGPGDGTRLVLTGGLGALLPVRAALLGSLGLDPARPGGGVVQAGTGTLLDAGAQGAALLAAGLADPGDRYPHALRIAVNRVVRDRLETEFLQLTAPGMVDLEWPGTVYLLDDSGGTSRPLLVTVRPPTAAPAAGEGPLMVQVVPTGGEATPAVFQPGPRPDPGIYRVGVRGGPDGPAVVLQPVAGGEPLAYRLTEPALTIPDRREGPAGR